MGPIAAAKSSPPLLVTRTTLNPERRSIRPARSGATHAIDVRGPSASAGDTLLEVQWAILHMRDMISAWRVLQGEVELKKDEWQSPTWEFEGELDSPPWTPEGPAVLLHLALGYALEPCSPVLRTFREGEEPLEPFAGELAAWNLCCLQLFNHIVEQATESKPDVAWRGSVRQACLPRPRPRTPATIRTIQGPRRYNIGGPGWGSKGVLPAERPIARRA